MALLFSLNANKKLQIQKQGFIFTLYLKMMAIALIKTDLGKRNFGVNKKD